MLDVVHLLEKLISFTSLSKQEDEVSDWLTSYLQSFSALNIQQINKNILIKWGNTDSKEKLLLNTHLDVVPPSPNHAYEPFEPFQKDGKIYGRGSTDAKGSLSSMVGALTELLNENYTPKNEIIFAFTICEEAQGAHNGVVHLRENGYFNEITSAIVGEPTLLHPCIAQKGILILELNLRGKSGHAARIPKKDNLIYAIPPFLKQLESISFNTENEWIGKTKITPTRINAGTANNMAAEKVSLIVDCRTIPDVSNQEILDAIKKVVTNVEIKIISDRFQSVSTSTKSRIAQIAQKVSNEPFFGSPTSSDWAFLKGIPTVKIGPGDSNQSHTSDEFIEIDQLKKGVELYKNVIVEFDKYDG